MFRKFIWTATKILALIVLIILFAIVECQQAMAGTIVSANTEVYVRTKDGDIAGSLYKGDTAIYCGEKNGWVIIEINGKEFKVWNEYVNKEEVDNVDEVEYSKIRKSKSEGKSIRNKREAKIKGSIFDDKYFW